MSSTNKSITTAISYANGSPHMGHIYEIIVADCLARHYRQSHNVDFQTGTDEHGQKIYNTALDKQLQPIDLCNIYVQEFKNIYKDLGISHNRFIRTTDKSHKDIAQELWLKCSKDIYLDVYEGWYNPREEKFLTEVEASKLNYMDGATPLLKMSEPSYFFRLSHYQKNLMDLIGGNFIYPESLKLQILQRLEEPLHDLSISRTSFSWGIPVPNDDKHVMYVWFDALANYLSLGDSWPADIHLIGKDIVWFHAVIWPAMLMSAGLPMPKKIVCHGFVNGPDGRKMSKSWGNVVSPSEMLKKYPADVLRYFLLKECSFPQDVNFSEPSLAAHYNGELSRNLGNLVQRSLALIDKYCEGIVPDITEDISGDISGDITEGKIIDISKINNYYEEFKFSEIINYIFEKLTVINVWLSNKAPWKMSNEGQRCIILSNLIRAIREIVEYLEPIMPNIVREIYSRIGQPGEKRYKVTTGEPLFPKL